MSEVEIVGFERLIDALVKIFQVMYMMGYQLFNFFSTPLYVNMDDSTIELLGDIVMYTPFELMFGFGLAAALAFCVMKFFVPFI